MENWKVSPYCCSGQQGEKGKDFCNNTLTNNVEAAVGSNLYF